MVIDEFKLYLFGDKNGRVHYSDLEMIFFLLKSPVPGDGGGYGGVWGGA